MVADTANLKDAAANHNASEAKLKQNLVPLENGDQLSRLEFEQRYLAMPPNVRAELIEGVVYVASPVRLAHHGKPHAALMAWLTDYWLATPGVELADNTTVRLDWDNEPQPDVLLRIERGGQSSISQDDYVEGAPELMVEVAASSAAYDLHSKKTVYRRNGVQEYIVWQIAERHLIWFQLCKGAYVAFVPDESGVIRSQVFPGLWLNVPALLTGQLRQVVATLQQGLKTPEHASFVKQLAAK